MRDMDINNERFQRRVSAYLEMDPAILVAVLNFHYKGLGAFNQNKFFDLRCLTEALLRSEIDISSLSVRGDSISLDGPFTLNDERNKITKQDD